MHKKQHLQKTMSDINSYTPFTFEELSVGFKIGELRFFESRRLKLKSVPLENDDGRSHYIQHFEREVISVLMEVVVGRSFDPHFFPSVNTYHNVGDIGQDIEIRSTHHPSGGLIARSNDKLSRKFVLVIGTLQKGYCIKGWEYGTTVKEKGKYWPPVKTNQVDAWCYHGPLRTIQTIQK